MGCVYVCKFNYLYTQVLHSTGETSRFTCGTSESKAWSHRTAGSSLPFPQSTDGQRQDQSVGYRVHYQFIISTERFSPPGL